ncbi:MAG: hypothetical protein Q8T11_13125 [Elusimicrobiota bacterium]|nr:hypothetical protein [Elusimicrobiota bacterium]
MFQEKRPTCVTVIGWAWIIIGGLMCFSAIMGFIASVMMRMQPQGSDALPDIVRIFPILAVLQVAIGALGIFSGISLLKLRPWSRRTLETLTWLLILFTAGCGVTMLVPITMGHLNQFGIFSAILGLFTISVYGVPLGIMVKYLRSDAVKDALTRSAEPSASADARQ